MLVTVGVAVGFATVDEDKFEPLHKYAVVLPPGLAVKETVPPLHIGLVLVGAAVGIGLTTIVVI